jgi:hypothetical protein
LLLALLTPGSIVAQGVRLEGGLSLATGAYLFEERTTTWALSTGLAIERGAFTLRGSVPLYLQNTTLVSASGLGQIPTGGSSSGTVADSGRARHQRDGAGSRHQSLDPVFSHGAVEVPTSAAAGYETAVGDPTLSLSWRSHPLPGASVTLGAAVKAPVADTSTFGTGRWEVGATLATPPRLGRAMLLGLDLAYWHLGDLDDLEFRDPLYGGLSLGYLSASGWGGTLMVAGGTTILDGFDPRVRVGAGFSRLSAGGSWGAHSTLGLTETSPDLTVGFVWSVRLLR